VRQRHLLDYSSLVNLSRISMSFGELRSALQQTPSVGAFRQVCAVCDRASDRAEVEEVWAPYARAHMRGWGEEIRQASMNDLLKWLHGPPGEPPRGVSFAEHLHLTYLLQPEYKLPYARTQLSPADRLRELTERLPTLLAQTRQLTMEELNVGGVEGLERFLGELCRMPEARGLDALRLYHLQHRAHHVLLSERGLQFIANSPHMESLRELDLCGQRLSAEALSAFVGAQLVGLRRLDLRACQLRGERVKALASSEVFGRLEELNLQDNPLGDGGVDVALGTPGAMPNLRHLTLGTTQISSEGLRHVLECHTSRAQPLSELNVNENPLGLAGMRVLTEHPGAQGLRSLVAGGCGFDAEAMELLCGATRQMAGLRRLFLWGNTLGDAGVERLAGSGLLAQLDDLHLDRVQMSERGFIRLITSPYALGLQRLSIQRNELGLAAVRALVDSAASKTLEELSIGYNPIPWIDALERMCAEGAMPRLRRLELDARWYETAGSALGARGVGILAQSPIAMQLEHLSLDRQMVGDDGVAQLLSGPRGFPRLHTLSLQGASCTERGLKLLCSKEARDKLPSLRTLHMSSSSNASLIERIRHHLDLQSLR
jgi:hypothetical protein